MLCRPQRLTVNVNMAQPQSSATSRTYCTRPLEQRDRRPIADLVQRVGNFSSDEIETALELVDEWLAGGEASDYICWVIEDDEGVRGYVCIGPTPLTDGTFDLYWIAVDPSAQRRGYGQALTRLAEEEARARGGRLLLIETASHETYAATIRFYERVGYELVSTIPDFYKVGDDKLTFAKRLI
jgi:ribosomal protein S18 acetylase RimI-like enzyme